MGEKVKILIRFLKDFGYYNKKEIKYVIFLTNLENFDLKDVFFNYYQLSKELKQKPYVLTRILDMLWVKNYAYYEPLYISLIRNFNMEFPEYMVKRRHKMNFHKIDLLTSEKYLLKILKYIEKNES